MLQGKPLWTTPLKEKHQGAVYTVEKEVITGLEKYFNSSLPFGQITLKYCNPGALAQVFKLINNS